MWKTSIVFSLFEVNHFILKKKIEIEISTENPREIGVTPFCFSVGRIIGSSPCAFLVRLIPNILNSCLLHKRKVQYKLDSIIVHLLINLLHTVARSQQQKQQHFLNLRVQSYLKYLCLHFVRHSILFLAYLKNCLWHTHQILYRTYGFSVMYLKISVVTKTIFRQILVVSRLPSSPKDKHKLCHKYCTEYEYLIYCCIKINLSFIIIKISS